MTITFQPTEVRASEIARGCDRMSVMRALGYESQQHDGETLEWFARGNLFEEYVARQLIAKHGKENVRRQVEIRHPLGVGHADALIVPERLLVEIKSSQAGNLTTPVFENGVNQLRFYLRFCDDADEGALMMINPSTLKPAEVFTVRLTEGDILDIDDTVQRIQYAIRHADKDGTMPHRVCHKPGDARGMMCSFAGPCFEGWEPPPVSEVNDPDAVQAAMSMASVTALEAPHKAALKELEPKKKEAQQALATLVPEGDSTVGPFSVRRTHVVRQPSFSVKAFQAAGLDIEPLAEFFRGGSEHDRFTVTKAEEWGDVEYGSAPF